MKVPELYNRQTKKIELENTYKVNGLAFLYKNTLGRALTKSLLNKSMVSKAYARYVKSPKSLGQIPKFIDHYQINTEEVKEPIHSFKCFNDFFIRELKENARPIDNEPSHLISPADSRLMIFDLSEASNIPVKGYWYSLESLLKDEALAAEYADGWCFVYRLAPNDYHRYSYIDKGTQDGVRRIKGVLHSVHPLALAETRALIAKNYRELTILHTENFGDVLHLEVGALLVGKIIQGHDGPYSFERGEEKGYFEYGGSTVVQIFKKGSIQPDADILAYSQKRIETLVQLGEKVGLKAT